MDHSNERTQKAWSRFVLFVLIHYFSAKDSLTQWLNLITLLTIFANSIVHCHFFRNIHLNSCLHVKSYELKNIYDYTLNLMSFQCSVFERQNTLFVVAAVFKGGKNSFTCKLVDIFVRPVNYKPKLYRGSTSERINFASQWLTSAFIQFHK